MDALKLKLRAKDQLHPLLTELMQSYTRFSSRSSSGGDWAGRPKLLNWLIELNQLKGASDEISDEQARQVRLPCRVFFGGGTGHHADARTIRQMLFDIEHAYAE